MFRLYKYELKKIFSQKFFVLAFTLIFAFFVGVSAIPVVTGSINSVKKKDEISGRIKVVPMSRTINKKTL